MQQQTFDAVLMDLHMPVMDGFRATRRIRQLPQGHELPIIAMTMPAMAQDRIDGAAAGMNAPHCKPTRRNWHSSCCCNGSNRARCATPATAMPSRRLPATDIT